MKIFLNFLKILIFILALYALSQNSIQAVDISIFGKSYYQVSLMTVIIITLTIGAVLGGVFMAFSMIQSQGEIRQLKQKNRNLLTELENLRNISIDEIPDEALPPPEPAVENLKQSLLEGDLNG